MFGQQEPWLSAFSQKFPLDLARITRHSLLHQLGIRLLPECLNLTHEALISLLVGLMVPPVSTESAWVLWPRSIIHNSTMHSPGLLTEPVTREACHTDPTMTGRTEEYDPRKAKHLLLIMPLN